MVSPLICQATVAKKEICPVWSCLAKHQVIVKHNCRIILHFQSLKEYLFVYSQYFSFKKFYTVFVQCDITISRSIVYQFFYLY